MISGILVSFLRADNFIAARLGTYNNIAAIFSDIVPKKAPFPSITVRTMQSGVREAVKVFNIYIDYWDRNSINASREAARIVCDRIENILDSYVYDGGQPGERYSTIRFRFLSGYCATADEYDGIHYNLFFNARACRKKWIDNIEPTTTAVPTTTTGVPTTIPIYLTTTINPTTTAE